ncbi:MAG: hypothetical protein V1668_01175 [Patescibacteria group bacterium]
MRLALMLVSCALISVGLAYPAIAVDQAPYFCFGEQAQAVLDSLEHGKSPDTMTMVVLAHNITFKNRDKKMREKAEKLLEKWAKHDTSTLVEAYLGSVQMIKVRDKGKIVNGLKIVGSIFGGESPYMTARKAFGRISQAVKDDPNNLILRFLRSTAAVESAEYLPELLAVAREDLQYLNAQVLSDDTVGCFFLWLTWAKYYHNPYLAIDDPNAQILAEHYICAAWELAHQSARSPDYQAEADRWERKIFFKE